MPNSSKPVHILGVNLNSDDAPTELLIGERWSSFRLLIPFRAPFTPKGTAGGWHTPAAIVHSVASSGRQVDQCPGVPLHRHTAGFVALGPTLTNVMKPVLTQD